MKIISRGDQIQPGAYAVRARYERSVLLFDADNRALFVVDQSIGAGPLNLVTSNPNAFVDGDELDLPPRWKAPVFDSSMPRLDRAAREKLSQVLSAALPRHAPPESLISLFFPAQLRPQMQRSRDALFQKAFTHISAGCLAAGIRLIRGCGEGLTPSGDDFICGWMLACRLWRKPATIRILLEQARGKNLVSNAFLGLSANGRVNIAVKQLLESPTDGRVKKVCAFGHSSGADLLCGMAYGLKGSKLTLHA